MVSQNFFCCSQNLPKQILVLKKSILKPLFTVYRLFINVNLGVDPLPPPFGKSLHFRFFLHPSLKTIKKYKKTTKNVQNTTLPYKKNSKKY